MTFLGHGSLRRIGARSLACRETIPGKVTADPKTEDFVSSLVKLESLGLLSEEAFQRILHLEKRRAERSGKGFVLMQLASGGLLDGGSNSEALRKKLAFALSELTRETDITGWCEAGCVLGVIFTEIDATSRIAAIDAISSRTRRQLSSSLSPEQIEQVHLSFYAFPEELSKAGEGCPILKPELAAASSQKRVSVLAKRTMDMVGSLFALILFLPLLTAIAIAVRLSSKGPILFRQQRVGLHGRSFTFLKFRSMYTETDQKLHEEFVTGFISGTTPAEGGYKMKDDPRVTPIGKILRRTSLDELPQFFNVLQGSMSLVGPRPPIGYEVNRYATWHRRRFLTVKPGITGLWQVRGRSKVKFDDMVRLDLQYAKSWSLWLDIKILVKTPRAVLVGDGAY